ncbi:hypothetical protein G7054_g8301 [Neopestalotiopsis clavispora]|nr:hypothetical protein G7054_g8301 [Neopestalotiopsis clavispora]
MSERIRSRLWGADDWVLTLVTIKMVPITTFMILLSQAGLGLDAWNLTGDQIDRVLFLFFFEEVFYPCALALIKISILLFYLRVFPNRTIRTLVYVLIFLNIGYAAAFSIALIFQCNPVRGAWEAWDGQHPATCLDTNTMGFAAAGANIVLDVATLTLPLHDVTKLRMGLRKKIQVLAMFAVGFFVTLISILRLKSLIEFGSTKNPTQDYVEAAYWSMIELCVGILCASMPAIRALLVQALPAIFGSQIYGSGLASHPTKSDRYGISRGDKNKPLSSTDASGKEIMVKNEWAVLDDRNSHGSDVELFDLESTLRSGPPGSDDMMGDRPMSRMKN